MSFVIAVPEMMTAAAADLSTIGLNLSVAHAAVAASTLAVLPAAADEVSASIAQLFSRYGQDYKAMAAHAAAFEQQFVQALTADARSNTTASPTSRGTPSIFRPTSTPRWVSRKSTASI